jgi:hypothetical protein
VAEASRLLRRSYAARSNRGHRNARPASRPVCFLACVRSPFPPNEPLGGRRIPILMNYAIQEPSSGWGRTTKPVHRQRCSPAT